MADREQGPIRMERKTRHAGPLGKRCPDAACLAINQDGLIQAGYRENSTIRAEGKGVDILGQGERRSVGTSRERIVEMDLGVRTARPVVEGRRRHEALVRSKRDMAEKGLSEGLTQGFTGGDIHQPRVVRAVVAALEHGFAAGSDGGSLEASAWRARQTRSRAGTGGRGGLPAEAAGVPGTEQPIAEVGEQYRLAGGGASGGFEE